LWGDEGKKKGGAQHLLAMWAAVTDPIVLNIFIEGKYLEIYLENGKRAKTVISNWSFLVSCSMFHVGDPVSQSSSGANSTLTPGIRPILMG
jgi:hypothetical protein